MKRICVNIEFLFEKESSFLGVSSQMVATDLSAFLKIKLRLNLTNRSINTPSAKHFDMNKLFKISWRGRKEVDVGDLSC